MNAPVDPGYTLPHRHRELCERAVGTLDLAADPEVPKGTGRIAARPRRQDATTLAEELYALVPRAEGCQGGPGQDATPGLARWLGQCLRRAALPLLPDAPGVATFAAVPVLVCGTTALGLIFHATGALTVTACARRMPAS